MSRGIEIKGFREALYSIRREQEAAEKMSRPHEDDSQKSLGEENRMERRVYPIPDGIAAQQQPRRTNAGRHRHKKFCQVQPLTKTQKRNSNLAKGLEISR